MIDLPAKSASTLRIVVDAMGGDYSPENEVRGTLFALEALPNTVEIVLVGKEKEVRDALGGKTPSNLFIVPADDVVGMGDEPSSIVKHRKNSSLYVGLNIVTQGLADAFVSAGNTGAVMATATMMCGRIPGVSRPTIGSFFPSSHGGYSLVLDVGANVDSKAHFLRDFAVMGSVYCQRILDIPSPTIGLLNIGEEREKGREIVREAYELLEKANVNFLGNVEGRDILRGSANVVVCDGFEGNIVLKFAESVLPFLRNRFVEFANQGLIQKVTVALFRPVLRKILAGMDYQEYGGVPLLGVNGVVIIGHGSSSPKAITNMIRRAVEMVQKDVNGAIRSAIMDEQNGENQKS